MINLGIIIGEHNPNNSQKVILNYIVDLFNPDNIYTSKHFLLKNKNIGKKFSKNYILNCSNLIVILDESFKIEVFNNDVIIILIKSSGDYKILSYKAPL